MLLTEQIPNISAKVNLLAKVVWPALATLVPAAIAGAVKWVQDHTSKRRSAELTERISTLAKRISELPVLSLSSATSAATPQSALTAELESALRELTSLQKTRAIRRFTGLTTTTAKVRAALLLYRPVGMAAWTLHLAFYVYSFCLVFALVAVFSDQSTPFISSVADLFAFIFIFGAFGIPPLVIRYFAARIHRAQCAQAQATASSSPLGHPAETSLLAVGQSI